MSNFKHPKIDGFQSPSLNIDGFHGTHRIHDKGAPAEKIDRYSASADTIFLKKRAEIAHCASSSYDIMLS